MKAAALSGLMREAGEILAMTVASINTARSGRNPQSAIRNPR
jgi:hypothetical protein